MNRLTFPLSLFQLALRDLTRGSGQPLRYPTGLDRRGELLELLVRRRGGESTRWLQVQGIEVSPPDQLPDGADVVLYLGRGGWRGVARGLVRTAVGVERLDRLNLVGPGMHDLPLGGTAARLDADAPVGETVPPDRWSRTVGGLGGMPVWARLRRLRVAVIGAGRTGSILAQALARQGVSVTLIDPDAIEQHNLGEMALLGEGDCGRPKAQALADALASAGSRRPEPVVASVTRQQALGALRECDFLFCSVDNDAGRLAAALAASLFLKPLLDVGTGIHGHGSGRQMGADVRLVLPPGPCLLCLGGLQAEAEALRVLASAEQEESFLAGRTWSRERAGSLASLNQLAAGCALRLFEDLVAERVSESTWLHAEYDPAGRLAVAYPLSRVATPCRLCRLAGGGEEGLSQLPRLLREWGETFPPMVTEGTTRQVTPTWLL